MNKCPFCHLKHDPQRTNCNDPATGALIRRAGPLTKPIKLELTPYGALDLLVRRVNEIKGQWTESLDTAMQRAEEVITRERDRLSYLAIDMMKPEVLTCVQLLEHARDSLEAADAELQAAFKLASGMACLLLLDMIRETATMAARTRAIIAAASADAKEEFNVYCEGDGSWMSRHPRIFTTNRLQAGSWNRQAAENLCPGGAYRIVAVGTEAK